MELTRKLLNGQFCKSCENYVKTLDKHISNNLKTVGIETRPSKSNGLWCYLLLPLILINYTILYSTTPLYQTVSLIAVGLFFNCTLFILFLSLSGNIILEAEHGGSVASSLISTMLIYIFPEQDLLTSLVISLSCVFSFNLLLKYILIKFPKTFTLGEAIVVVQSIPLFVSATSIKYIQSLYYGDEEEFAFINTIVFTILVTTALIITSIFVMKAEYKTLSSLAYIVTAGAVVLLIKWHIIMGRKCLIEIFQYIFMDNTRLKLFMFWFSLLMIAILVVWMQTRKCTKANTMTRKTFHILASLVFLSGILTDIPLMTLAAGVGLSLLLFVEALRIAEIEKISPALQSAFVIYCDEKDSGSFAMTPLYLFAGLACPLVLVPEPATLDLLAGVLAVGVGDTAASCAGSIFGKNRWAAVIFLTTGSNRTLEGTAFNILSQVAVVYALQYFDLIQMSQALPHAAVAATVSALVEAKTDQVDNLILPLVTLLAFQATSFIS